MITILSNYFPTYLIKDKNRELIMPSIFKLKKLVTESANLSTVLDYFLQLSEKGSIIPSSKALDEEEIKQNDTLNILIQVVEHTAGDFLKRKIQINHPMICSVEKEFFYHGIFFCKDIPIPISVFYFSDLNKGFFALSGIGKSTEMFRFSLMITDKMPVMNSSQVAH
jgi:hypothetical protein